MMDDFSIIDERLESALRDLRIVNRWLGGYGAARSALHPLFRRASRLRLLDLGTGVADYPEYLVQAADRNGCHLEVTALDANPATVRYAQATLDQRLSRRLRSRIDVVVGDALDLAYDRDTFDVTLASLFLHHFHGQEAIDLLREMDRVSRRGIVVNDLHRHPIAYYGVKVMGVVLARSVMFNHDGPLSVLRGFTHAELERLARAADLDSAQVYWRWAFRWVLHTLEL